MQEFRVFRAIGLSFVSWFRNFVPFTLITALLYSPAIYMVATSDPSSAESVEEMISGMFTVPSLLTTAAAMLVPPMLTYRVIQELNGTKVSMLTSLAYGLRGILPVVLIGIIVGLLSLIPFAGAIISIILICVWFVAGPAAVAEKLGPIAALSRSAELTRGRRWGVFGVLVLYIAVAIVFSMVFIMPFMLNVANGREQSLESIKTMAIAYFVVMGLFQMLIAIVEAVSYALLRTDKDGMTHEQLAKVFE